MKNLIGTVLTVALATFFLSVPVQAQEGELEISGNLSVLSGWQRVHGSSTTATTVPTNSGGVLNEGGATIAPSTATTDQFGYAVDELEIDIAKQFGENIRLRSDMDFSRVGGFALEQGYVTVNIPAGNGGELMVGKFNAGIGLDPVDRNELSTVSHSTIHRAMIPDNMTGANINYAATESFSFDIFVVNDLQDAALTANTTSDLPSYGLKVNWESGEGSWVRLTGAAGSEKATKKNMSFLGDAAASLALSDGFDVGVEGLYRQDNSCSLAENCQYIAGTLQASYAFSDIWDGTLRAGFLWDLDARGTAAAPNQQRALGYGIEGQVYDVTLATGYSITDGAKLIIEGRYDLGKASAGGPKGQVYGVAGAFYYEF